MLTPRALQTVEAFDLKRTIVETRKWIEEVTRESLGSGDFQTVLKNGVALCWSPFFFLFLSFSSLLVWCGVVKTLTGLARAVS